MRRCIGSDSALPEIRSLVLARRLRPEYSPVQQVTGKFRMFYVMNPLDIYLLSVTLDGVSRPAQAQTNPLPIHLGEHLAVR